MASMSLASLNVLRVETALRVIFALDVATPLTPWTVQVDASLVPRERSKLRQGLEYVIRVHTNLPTVNRTNTR